MIRYASLSGPTVGVVDKAERTLVNGWTQGGHPEVSLSRGCVPWASHDGHQRSWNFWLHSWDMMTHLLQAHSLTGELRFLEPCIEVAIDWLDFNANDQNPSPFAWYDMAVGRRAYQLSYLIQAAEVHSFDSEIVRKLWRSLEDHQSVLSKEENIAYHSNHGFYQIVGQLAMGKRFGEKSQVMSTALVQGNSRLRHILKVQFSSEGVHLEHSPGYHAMVYKTLRAVLNSSLVEDREIFEFAEKIEASLYWFVQPNQFLANFGDTDYKTIAVKPQEALDIWSTNSMRHAASGGIEGEAPKHSIAAFKDSGYFVYKQEARAADQKLSKPGYLAQQCGFHSRTHKHADNLSFIWHDRGSDILVDAGRYGYLSKTSQGSPLWLAGNWYSAPGRLYCESTRAHNTLEFDCMDYPRKGISPLGSMIERHTTTDNGLVVFESQARHFKGLLHSRVLFYMPNSFLIVFDWIKDNFDLAHDVKQWFHLANHLRASSDELGCRVEIPDSDTTMHVRSLVDEAQPLPIIRGQTDPYMQGWWSGNEGEILPNDAIGFEQKGISTGKFATLFTFGHGVSTMPNMSKINASGRQGVFRWMEGEKSLIIKFDRKREGNLEVELQVLS